MLPCPLSGSSHGLRGKQKSWGSCFRILPWGIKPYEGVLFALKSPSLGGPIISPMRRYPRWNTFPTNTNYFVLCLKWREHKQTDKECCRCSLALTTLSIFRPMFYYEEVRCVPHCTSELSVIRCAPRNALGVLVLPKQSRLHCLLLLD